jgi:hydrogenase maturation factor
MMEACADLRVTLVGGHTEVTYALPRPLVAGCMLGEVGLGGLVTSGGAREGDTVLLLGSAGIEGTAVLAHEAATRLAEAGLSGAELARARAFLRDPGISVVAAAQAVCSATRPHALHDVTEGGVATGLRELAGASGKGLRVRAPRVAIAPETARICAALGLDPWGLLGSGALLAAVAPGDAAAAIREAEGRGIACAAIGEIRPQADGMGAIDADGREGPLPAFERDEVARYLD